MAPLPDLCSNLRSASLTRTNQKKQWKYFSLLFMLLLILCAGCATQGSYRESHQVKNLNVVFVDQHTLHQEWAKRTGTAGIRFGSQVSTRTGVPALTTVNGFYDFTTQTIYCPKWNFEVCGHELHHAVIGQFHSQE